MGKREASQPVFSAGLSECRVSETHRPRGNRPSSPLRNHLPGPVGGRSASPWRCTFWAASTCPGPDGCLREPPGGLSRSVSPSASEPHRVAQRAHLSVVWGQTSSGFEGREARLTADSGTHFIGCVARFSRGNPWSPGQADPSVDTVVHVTCRWSRAGTEQRGLLSHSS